jgi:hypothetical protein
VREVRREARMEAVWVRVYPKKMREEMRGCGDRKALGNTMQ